MGGSYAQESENYFLVFLSHGMILETEGISQDQRSFSTTSNKEKWRRIRSF